MNDNLLTPAEKRVFTLVLEGLSNQEIAEKLNVSVNTVKTHVARILKKNGVKNRRELILKTLKSIR